MANNTELNTGPFIWGAAQNAAGQPDDTIARTGPDISRETFMDDTFRAFMLLYRSGVWHKGMNADLLDGQHADEFQPICATLTALCALSSYGLVAKTAENTIAAREITVGTGLDILNGDGIAGNPDIALDVTELTTVTAVAGDHVVISDTTDSTTKKALISDIVALVPTGAPASAQYVTLATDATLTSERVLTAGTGLDLVDAGAGSTATIDLDLNELTTAAAAAADHLIFVDADDPATATKKTTMANALVALGAQPIDATLTALAAYNTNGLLTQTAADTFTGRTIAITGDFATIANGDGVGGNPTIAGAADLENIVDVWAVDASGNVSGVGTIGSGAITSSGFIKSTSSSAGIGYATGAGGTVTQLTSKSTDVTLDKICGDITMHNAALAAGATVSFAVNNSVLDGTEFVMVQHTSGGSSGSYAVEAYRTGVGGLFGVNVTNITTGSLSEAIVIRFIALKGATA